MDLNCFYSICNHRFHLDDATSSTGMGSLPATAALGTFVVERALSLWISVFCEKAGMTLPEDEKPNISASGNPRITKGDGDAAVHAYISAMPGWKKEIGQQVDTIVTNALPNVRKQVRWNTPFYGKSDGWFLALYCYKAFVQISFLTGSSLTPEPPKASKVAGTRYWDIYEDDGLDESQLSSWVQQALELEGQKL